MLFSIIIATHNAEANIEKTLQSLIDQSYDNYEVLIIDSVSNDNTLKIVDKYKRQLASRLSVVSEPDDGIYEAMNKGVSLARGEWIYFLGSGDTLIDNAVLTDTANFIKHNSNIDVVYGNMQWGNTSIISHGKFTAARLINLNLNHQTIFCKKKVFKVAGRFDTKYPISADYLFNIRWFTNKQLKHKYFPRTVVIYDTSGVSSVSDDNVFLLDKSKIVKKYFTPLEIIGSSLRVFFHRARVALGFVVKLDFEGLSKRVSQRLSERKAVDVMGVTLDSHDFVTFGKQIDGYFAGSGLKVVSKVNSEFLVRSSDSEEFRKCLNGSDLLIPDGIGVLWAAKYLSLRLTRIPLLRSVQAALQVVFSGLAIMFSSKYRQSVLPERLSGVEILYTMLSAAERNGKSVYIFGSRKHVLPTAVKVIASKYPKLTIAGYHEGYGFDDQEVINSINASKAALLIVALGSPKQEYWIRDHASKFENLQIAVGEGGSLDYVAGVHKRAPKIIQRLGLEWAWRGVVNPNLTGDGHRLKRVWKAVPVFVYKTYRYKVKTG